MKNLSKYGIFAAFAAFVVIVAAVWASSSSENNTTHQQRATSSSSEGVVSPQSTVTETPAAGTVESFKGGANAPTKLEENPTNEAPATSTTEDNASDSVLEEGIVLPPSVVTPENAEEEPSANTQEPIPGC